MEALTDSDFYRKYVCSPGLATPAEIADDPRFFPFFKDAVGAVDGTLITANPPYDIRARWRNRKGDLTWNILAASTFDMRFCYVLSGWEGSACDTTLFSSARSEDFYIPPGKYYLADAGFAHCDALLVPYRAVRYHLREWKASKLEYVHLHISPVDVLTFAGRRTQRSSSICGIRALATSLSVFSVS